MDEKYIDSLTKKQRAAWGVQIFIRLWLSGMCQSQAAQNWTIAQLAILFEVTQAQWSSSKFTRTLSTSALALSMVASKEMYAHV